MCAFSVDLSRFIRCGKKKNKMLLFNCKFSYKLTFTESSNFSRTLFFFNNKIPLSITSSNPGQHLSCCNMLFMFMLEHNMRSCHRSKCAASASVYKQSEPLFEYSISLNVFPTHYSE